MVSPPFSPARAIDRNLALTVAGAGGYASASTDWMQATFPPESMRVSMPVPIVLPITEFTRYDAQS